MIKFKQYIPEIRIVPNILPRNNSELCNFLNKYKEDFIKRIWEIETPFYFHEYDELIGDNEFKITLGDIFVPIEHVVIYYNGIAEGIDVGLELSGSMDREIMFRNIRLYYIVV